ncbi:MAG: YgfZ/GcvT domain-containing protein, partial [Methylophilaceae bacterium]
VNISSSEAPTEGDKIVDIAQNEVGQIVRVAPNRENGFDALIEIRIDAQQTGQVFWNKAPVTFNTLPYSLET